MILRMWDGIFRCYEMRGEGIRWAARPEVKGSHERSLSCVSAHMVPGTSLMLIH